MLVKCFTQYLGGGKPHKMTIPRDSWVSWEEAYWSMWTLGPRGDHQGTRLVSGTLSVLYTGGPGGPLLMNYLHPHLEFCVWEPFPKPSICLGPSQDSLPPEGAWRKPAATLLAEVVHEDDLLQDSPGSCVEDTVDGSQEGGPGFVVETEDDAGCGQAVLRVLLQTPTGKKTREPWRRKTTRGAQHP